MNISTDLTSFIAKDSATLVTDSRAVALAFGKRQRPKPKGKSAPG